MKQKHVDAAREVRLWVGQIILPIMSVYCAFNIDKLEAAKDKVSSIIRK